MSWNRSSCTERTGRRALARAVASVLGALLAATLGATAALAQEATPRPAAGSTQEVAPRLAPPPTSASLIMNMINRPAESPAAALAESLRPDGAPPALPRAEAKADVLSDGSVRYRQGNTTLILKNPCPEGDPFHDKPPLPRPLPGRNRR
jgi:hypothetical protein